MSIRRLANAEPQIDRDKSFTFVITTTPWYLNAERYKTTTSTR